MGKYECLLGGKSKGLNEEINVSNWTKIGLKGQEESMPGVDKTKKQHG